MNKGKYFFGYTNFKWNIYELKKMYSSSEKSWFSKKRIESGFAFLVGQWGMIHWLILNVNKMNAYEIAVWAGVEFTICGYVIKQIQKEKTNNDAPTDQK